MAKRKRWQAALSGLGEGVANASNVLMRQLSQQRQDQAILARQKAIDDQNFQETLLQKVAEGLDPAQAEAMARARGVTLDRSLLTQARPTLRRRLENDLGKPIETAKSMEDILSDDSIRSIARGYDDALLIGPQEEGTTDPFAGFAPEVREFAQRAETRRKGFREQPKEKVEITKPDGSTEARWVSPYSSPVVTKPDANAQGAIEGTKKVADIGVSGQAQADQSARVTAATEQAKTDVETNPTNVAATARREGSIAGARSNATFGNDLRLAQERAKIDLQNDLNKANAVNLGQSTRAAQQLRGFFDKMTELSGRINTLEGIPGRAVGMLRAGQAAIGDDPDVREMQQLIAANLRPLAVLMGVREANVSESETKQALTAIGIKPWSTHTEAVRALRNLQDTIDLAPVVAANAGTEAGIGERVQMVSQLTKQRRDAEQAAMSGGFEYYIDPIMNVPRKVIR